MKPKFRKVKVQYDKVQKEILKEVEDLIVFDVIPQKSEIPNWREDNEDVIIAINPIMGVMNFMNPTLAFIFKLCNSKNDIGDIEKILSQTYSNIDKKLIKTDLKNAIIQLFYNGYLKIPRKTDGKYILITDILGKKGEFYK